MSFKLYTLDNEFLKEVNEFPKDFTGIVEYPDGPKFWYVNGIYHRLDGPARIWSDGYKEWWINGRLHRIDGPAIECPSGPKLWWIDGKNIQCKTEQEFKLLIDIMKLKGLLI